MKSAIVVGSGVSGIAAAARLVERGVEARVLEAEEVVGGRIGTRRHESSDVDLGGRNFTAHDVHFLGLLQSLGVDRLADYRFNSVAAGGGRHFDMRSGGDWLARARRLVGNVTSAGPFDLLRLRNVVAHARKEAAGGTVASPYWIRLAEQTADPAASSYFGPAIADQVLRPWTLRMMASEPEEVYLGNLGPLLGREPGPLKRVLGGMGEFLCAARQKFDVRLGHRVESVAIEEDRAVGVEGATLDGRRFRERADIVVVATPAPVAASLVPTLPALAGTLAQVTYRPVATIVAEYARVDFPDGASGLFVPRGNAVCHIAKYDEGHRVRFSYAGVAARAAFATATLAELLPIGEETLRRLRGTLDRRGSYVGHVWYPGLCAHTWMHHRTVALLQQHASAVRGLGLTGDYWRGNSFDACTFAARETVDRLLDATDRTDRSQAAHEHASLDVSALQS